MRIALITDIHGNTFALDAVLEHIEADGGVNDYWFLGDYCAIGANPIGVLDRMMALDNAIYIRGNTDRYITEESYPDPSVRYAQNTASVVPTLAEVRAGFGWTQGVIMQATQMSEVDYWGWLNDLPVTYERTLPDGTNALAVHASPKEGDDGDGFHNGHSDDKLIELAGNSTADLILVGHTHVPHQRHINGQHWINAGSVGNPLQLSLDEPDVRACYGLLTADENGYQVDLRRVEYDVQAAIADLDRWRYASRAYPKIFYEGRKLAGWLTKQG